MGANPISKCLPAPTARILLRQLPLTRRGRSFPYYPYLNIHAIRAGLIPDIFRPEGEEYLPPMSVPHNKYPVTPNPETPYSKVPPSMPEGMRGNVTGVTTNHSSLVASVDTMEGCEWSDEGGAPEDPNISGGNPTAQLHDWQAGGMTSFQDNDDYRYNFPSDGFHAMHSDEEFGTDETSPISDWPEPDESSQGGIPIEPIKRR